MSRLYLLIAAVLLPALAQAEFQVNTYTTGRQLLPAIASDAAGNFVMVWSSFGQDGGAYGIFGQRFDSSLSPIGSEFQINTYTSASQTRSHVATDPAGNFVVAWSSDFQDGGYQGVFAQRFDASGTPLGSEFQVNTYTPNIQYVGGMASDAAGNFVVVWSSRYQLDGWEVMARRYDGSGVPMGGEFQVNTYTTDFQFVPAVATDGSGNFVVVWSSLPQSAIMGQRYNSAGVPQGGEFQVSTYTTYAPQSPTIASDGAGNFVVAWQTYGEDGDLRGIFGRRFDAAGVPLGPEFQVNTYTTGTQVYPRVARQPGGDFVVVWQDEAAEDGDSWGVFGQRYDAAGIPVGGEFQINSFTAGEQFAPEVATDGAGNFVTVWGSLQSFGGAQDGSLAGVFAQQNVPVATTSSSTVATTSSSTVSTSTSSSTSSSTTLPARVILGKKMDVKDSTGSEDRRRVLILAKESGTDLFGIDGDPTLSGATLRIVVNGATPSDQTYVLDPSGWSAALPLHTMYKYVGPTGADADPVKLVIIKRAANGKALLKVLVKGNVGTQNVDVVPPDGGISGGAILEVPGDARYCASFGGAAGGAELDDTPQRWRVLSPTTEAGCPVP
jgi:hypothetical protein